MTTDQQREGLEPATLGKFIREAICSTDGQASADQVSEIDLARLILARFPALTRPTPAGVSVSVEGIARCLIDTCSDMEKDADDADYAVVRVVANSIRNRLTSIAQQHKE